MVLYVEASDETMKSRLLKRGESSGRVDDNEETIKKRLETFHQVTQPVIDYYENEGKLKRVDSNQAPDQVFAQIKRILNGEPSEEEEAERARLEQEEKERKEKERLEREEKEKKEKEEKELKEKEEKERKEKEEKEKKEKEEKERKEKEEKDKKMKEKLEKERKAKQAEAQAKLQDSKVIFVIGGPGSGKVTHLSLKNLFIFSILFDFKKLNSHLRVLNVKK